MRLQLLIFLVGLSEVASLGGIFELRIRNFIHPSNRDIEGNCCSLNESDCRTECQPKFRICVKNYQVTIDYQGGCYFGEGQGDLDTGRVWHFPFSFRWPGTFSLIIESSSNKTSTLLSRMAMQQYLDMSPQWTPRTINSSGSVYEFDYRVRCNPDYYGENCDKMCRPRDDKFGHYTCGENGEINCLEGWAGGYCERAICSPNCHPLHGHCLTPSTCLCHSGWEGPNCSECTRYPGCKHGKCSKPFECECEEGWGGLFCNQDLNYCTNHKPCLNGGTCFNTGQGSYTCSCAEGFSGADCQTKGNSVCGCNNGGICRDTPTGQICSCPDPFTGNLCEINRTTPTICLTSPCANGGTCIPTKNNNYTCLCKSEFTGPDCSEKCSNCSTSLALTEELSPQHVILVVIVSVATPLMVVVAVGVVLVLKRRKETERRRNDELARRQNEANTVQCLKKAGFDMIVNEFDPGRVKLSNCDLFRSVDKCSPTYSISSSSPKMSPNLLMDPYNPPPAVKLNNTVLNKLATEV